MANAYLSRNPVPMGLANQQYRPYTPVQDAAIYNALEKQRIINNNQVSAPLVDPADFLVGGAGGLARFGLTKTIPINQATKAILKSGAYNTAEGAALGYIDSAPLSTVDDAKDYYRAVQGLRRFPLR